MDLSPSLSEPTHSLVPLDRVPNHRSLRIELGDAAIQVLDFEHHHLCTVGHAAKPEFILALLSDAECMEVRRLWRQEGRSVGG